MTPRNILITGAGSGIGARLYSGFREMGHNVFGVGMNGPDREVNFCKKTHDFLPVGTLFNRAEEAFMGPVDTLILNAGISHLDYVENHPLVAFENVISVNLVAPFIFISEFMRRIIGYGNPEDENYPYSPNFDDYRVIATTSQCTDIALRGCPAYNASKAGLEHMMRGLAKEKANVLPVSFFCVSPGGVEDTAIWNYAYEKLQKMRGMTPEEALAYNRQSPLGRNCTLDEVFDVYNFAVNDAPKYMSGTVLRMSGAMGV